MSLARREQPGVTMRFPTWGVILALVLTVVVCAWLGWEAFGGMRYAVQTQQQAANFENLRGEIMRLDEVLTMSAQMAAATGDPRWEARYNQAAPDVGRRSQADLRTGATPNDSRHGGSSRRRQLRARDHREPGLRVGGPRSS